MAPGAIIIAVVFVLQLLEKQKEFTVLLIALIDVSGKAAEDGDEHEGISDGGAQKLDGSAGNQRSQQGKGQASAENRHIQFIRTVPAGHKFCHAGGYFITEIF